MEHATFDSRAGQWVSWGACLAQFGFFGDFLVLACVKEARSLPCGISYRAHGFVGGMHWAVRFFRLAVACMGFWTVSLATSSEWPGRYGRSTVGAMGRLLQDGRSSGPVTDGVAHGSGFSSSFPVRPQDPRILYHRGHYIQEGALTAKFRCVEVCFCSNFLL